MTDENHKTGIESEETKTGIEDDAGARVDADTSEGADSENKADADRVRALKGTLARVAKMKAEGQEIPPDLKWADIEVSKTEDKKPDDMRQLIREEAQALEMEKAISRMDLSDEDKKAFNDERDDLLKRGYSPTEAVERAKAFLRLDDKYQQKEEKASRAGIPNPGKSTRSNFTTVSISEFQSMSQTEKKEYMRESTQKHGEVTFTS
jgi:hypothetical protein